MKRAGAGVALLAAAATLALAGCEREARRFSDVRPFGQPAEPKADGWTGNAWAVGEGKRWYRWYNCNGCHASGGGDIGPPLMDARWRYGSAPRDIVRTILHGRPNGMPAFAPRMPEAHAWQIAAYIRSMGGRVDVDVAPSRADTISSGTPELRRDDAMPRPEPPPSAAGAMR